jgi:hypothetical protein
MTELLEQAIEHLRQLPEEMQDHAARTLIFQLRTESYYSPVSNIGDIWSLEEGADESSIVLDIDKVCLNAFLQQFV